MPTVIAKTHKPKKVKKKRAKPSAAKPKLAPQRSPDSARASGTGLLLNDQRKSHTMSGNDSKEMIIAKEPALSAQIAPVGM